MTQLNKTLLLSVAFGISLTSCKKDPEPTNPAGGDGKTRYIIAATPLASTGVADYLLTANDLTKDSITTVGNGLEQDGTWRYYITHKNRFFSLLYGQGNPGAVTTYNLNGAGALTKVSDFQSESVHAFTTVKDDVLLIKVPRSGDTTVNAKFYRINAEQSVIAGEAQVNIVKLAGNGERAHFTWATQVGDKVFAPYMSIKGAAPDVFGTAFPDSSWIAILSYPGLVVEKVIRDNRTGSIGAYYNNGLALTEGGDVYGFSPASGMSSGKHVSSRPSGIVRVRAGATEFDPGYFFNVQQASGGHHMFRWDYAGDNKFLVQLYGEPNSVAATVRNRLAVVDVATQSFTWVSGAPADVKLSGISRNNLAVGDGRTVYVGINSDSEGAYVYSVDVTTAKATRGLKVSGGVITSINKLSY